MSEASATPMAETRNWVERTFDVQRRFIEQSHRATRRNLAAQRRFSRAFVNSMDAQRDAQREAMTLANSAFRSSLVLTRTSLPGDEEEVGEFEDAFEAGLASMADVGDEWGSIVTRTVAGAVEMNDDLVGLYEDLVDASFDAALEANDRLAERATRASEPPRGAVEIDIESEGS